MLQASKLRRSTLPRRRTLPSSNFDLRAPNLLATFLAVLTRLTCSELTYSTSSHRLTYSDTYLLLLLPFLRALPPSIKKPAVGAPLGPASYPAPSSRLKSAACTEFSQQVSRSSFGGGPIESVQLFTWRGGSAPSYSPLAAFSLHPLARSSEGYK